MPINPTDQELVARLPYWIRNTRSWIAQVEETVDNLAFTMPPFTFPPYTFPPHDHTIPPFTSPPHDHDGVYEQLSNKTSGWNVTPNDTNYPTEKLVKDELDLKEPTIGYTPEDQANKITTWPLTPTDDQYPSAALVSDTIDSLTCDVGETYVNVKNFGAVGDGATDDESAINAAVNSISGGVIFFPRGIYRIANYADYQGIYLHSNKHYLGEGIGATTIIRKPGETVHMFSSQPAHGDIDNMSIRHMTLDGNKTADAQGALAGIHCIGVHSFSKLTKSTFEHLTIANAVRYGIGIQSTEENNLIRILSCNFFANGGWSDSGTDRGDDVDVKNSNSIIIDNCFATGAPQHAFDLRTKDGKISNCTIHGYVEPGIALRAHTSDSVLRAIVSNVAVTNCDNGIFADGLMGLADGTITITNSRLWSNSNRGIYHRGCHAHISNCLIDGNTISGIRSESDSMITGCRITGNGEGITWGGSPRVVLVSACIISGNTTNHKAIEDATRQIFSGCYIP